MDKGKNWKEFFTTQGWINNNVIAAGENEEMQIYINMGDVSAINKSNAIDSALIMDKGNILCYEGPKGSVYFQWDDIIQVRVDKVKEKKSWL